MAEKVARNSENDFDDGIRNPVKRKNIRYAGSEF